MQHEEINLVIKTSGVDTNLISDGYHTFGELYEHRIGLFIALCNHVADSDCLYGGKKSVWKSKLHSDGSSFDGWFVMGIGEDAGAQITYHLPMDKWDDCYLAKEIDRAPEFDGHTSQDVLNRLKSL